MNKRNYVACSGNRVREHRQEIGVSQKQLAQMIGVTRQTIGLIEAGRYNPSMMLISKLMVVTTASYEELFPGYKKVKVRQ